MSSLFCCQGLRWMEGAVGSSGGEVKEGRVVGLPPESLILQVFLSHTAAVVRIEQIEYLVGMASNVLLNRK